MWESTLSLVGCSGILMLALIVLGHRGRNPLAVPLGLLFVDMFVWNFATWAYQRSGAPAWECLDAAFSPLTDETPVLSVAPG